MKPDRFQKEAPQRPQDPWILASEFIGGFLCGLWIGYALDQHYQTHPWGSLGGSILGFMVGLWNVWKRFSKP